MEIEIEKFMTSPLITVPSGSPVASAFELMQEKRIRHLPVIDATGEVIGILSLKDLIAVSGNDEVSVDLLMSTPVIAVDHTTSLRRAILKMLEQKISSLLVQNEKGDSIGIITTDDLLWYFAHHLKSEEPETESKSHEPFLSAMDQQTIGQLAHRLSLMGI